MARSAGTRSPSACRRSWRLCGGLVVVLDDHQWEAERRREHLDDTPSAIAYRALTGGEQRPLTRSGSGVFRHEIQRLGA